jgi:outer membrane protein assembly factor BamB
MMPRMKTCPRVRSSAASLVVALALACVGVHARAADDAIEGRWRGEITAPTERVEIALDLRRNERGELVAYLYQPLMNLYGVALPGTLEREGSRFVDHDYALSLARVEDRLEGTMTSLGLPVTLRRADALPSEVSVPQAPAGAGPRWRTKLGAPIYAAAAVRDGIAYVGTAGGVFQAVRVKDGTIEWTFSAGRAVHGEALVTPEHVYFACDTGFLYKLARRDGKEVWRYDLGDAQVPRIATHPAVFDYDYLGPRPLLADGTVYVGSGDGALHAVDDGAGTRRWRYATGGKVRVNAVQSGPHVVFGSLDGSVYALDAKSGALAWKRELRGPITTSPALLAGELVVGTRASAVYALRPDSGETIWRNLFWGSWVESEAVLDAGTLYIGSSDLRRVSALDPRDGHVAWRTDVFGSPWGRPALTARRVYVGAVGTDPYNIRHVGGVVALERDTGRIAWRWPSPDVPGALQTGFAAAPAIAGDTMVIGGLDGSLYAFTVD